MADGAEKGKSAAIAVAIIAALASVTVPVVTHFLGPQAEAPKPVQNPASTAASNQTPTPSIASQSAIAEAEKGEIARLGSKRQQEKAINIALAREHLRADETTEDAKKYVSKVQEVDPKDGKWAACSAELALESGELEVGLAKFRKAAELGEPGMDAIFARSSVNSDLLRDANNFRQTPDVSEADWLDETRLIDLKIPGTHNLIVRYGIAAKMRVFTKAKEMTSAERKLWDERSASCDDGHKLREPAPVYGHINCY